MQTDTHSHTCTSIYTLMNTYEHLLEIRPVCEIHEVTIYSCLAADGTARNCFPRCAKHHHENWKNAQVKAKSISLMAQRQAKRTQR
jgi:hypothetical protein